MSIQSPSTRSAEARPRRLLLTVHILATVGLFGANLVLVTLGFSAVTVARLSGWGLFRYWWVALKLAITLILTLVVLTVLVPRLGSAAAIAAAHASFDVSQRVPLAVAPGLATLFLVLNVALAVYKPGWRVRRPQHPIAATSIPEPTGAH